jgi:cellulose synthase operon protein YhjQ
MSDRKTLAEHNETPEDVATLYSWANLHGAKYRDFSASRAQTRERARQRVQEAIAAERERTREQAEVQRVAESQRAAEEQRAAQAQRQLEAERQSELAVQQAAQWAAQQPAWQRAVPDRISRISGGSRTPPGAPPQPPQGPPQPQFGSYPQYQGYRTSAPQVPQYAPQVPPPQQYAAPAPPLPQYAQPAPPQYGQSAPPPPQQYAAPAQPQYAPSAPPPPPQQFAPPAPQQYAPPAPPPPQYAAPAQPLYGQSAPPPPPQYGPSAPPQYGAQGRPQYNPPPAQYAAPAPPLQYAPPREDPYNQPRPQWAADPRENFSRPAWLAPNRSDRTSQPVPKAPEDTLQGSRDRLTSRWFALKGVFEGTQAPPEPAPAPVMHRAPALAVFSLAGGVGKTSMLATLGRALSARGERVLLVDTAPYGLLPFFFGARDQRPGQLRTFSPPGTSGDAPVQLVTIDAETLGPETPAQEPLTQEIARCARGASRVLIDLATASGATTRRIMRMAPVVLVPVVPDMNSVVSVGSIDSFFRHNSNLAGKQVVPFYILNQFDYSLPLHLDVREVLREQLGDRLLPFVLRRSPSVSEAMAEGMTVVDYAPNSTVAEDFGSLAGWVKSIAPVSATLRGVRWSER